MRSYTTGRMMKLLSSAKNREKIFSCKWRKDYVQPSISELDVLLFCQNLECAFGLAIFCIACFLIRITISVSLFLSVSCHFRIPLTWRSTISSLLLRLLIRISLHLYVFIVLLLCNQFSKNSQVDSSQYYPAPHTFNSSCKYFCIFF